MASHVNAETKVHFRNLLLITHYYALRTACRQVASLKSIGVKISTALLRYTDVIPADKAFYEAGNVFMYSKQDDLECIRKCLVGLLLNIHNCGYKKN